MSHFLDINQITKNKFFEILALAQEMKADPQKFRLDNKRLALILQKPSTRTRVSFDVAIQNLGGSCIVLSQNDIHLGKNETIEDTAKVLSRMVDCIAIRCFDHSDLISLSDNSSVPVINALTDYSHPCQIVAAFMTFAERLSSPVDKLTLNWFGDVNNVLQSYIHVAEIMPNLHLNIYSPYSSQSTTSNVEVRNMSNIQTANVVITDTWVSMGDKDAEEKLTKLGDYQVNKDVIKRSGSPIFSHCLPAHRGDEVTDEVIDADYSVVFDEAENRIWAQQAIIYLLLTGNL